MSETEEQFNALLKCAIAAPSAVRCGAPRSPVILRRADASLNLTSTYSGCRYAAPHLIKTGGAIVNISSITALTGQADAPAYCASKAGQIGLSKALGAPRAFPRCRAPAPRDVDSCGSQPSTWADAASA